MDERRVSGEMRPVVRYARGLCMRSVHGLCTPLELCRYAPRRAELYSSHFEPPLSFEMGVVPSSNCFRTPLDGGYQPTKHVYRGLT